MPPLSVSTHKCMYVFVGFFAIVKFCWKFHLTLLLTSSKVTSSCGIPLPTHEYLKVLLLRTRKTSATLLHRTHTHPRTHRIVAHRCSMQVYVYVCMCVGAVLSWVEHRSNKIYSWSQKFIIKSYLFVSLTKYAVRNTTKAGVCSGLRFWIFRFACIKRISSTN